MVRGHTEIPGESITGMKQGSEKRQQGSESLYFFGLFGVDTGRCADKLWQFFCACTVVFPLN